MLNDKALERYFELNEQKKALEKELKLEKEKIIEAMKSNDTKVVRFGSYFASLKRMSRSILDQAKVKAILGVTEFEACKRETEFDKLDVSKEA